MKKAYKCCLQASFIHETLSDLLIHRSGLGCQTDSCAHPLHQKNPKVCGPPFTAAPNTAKLLLTRLPVPVCKYLLSMPAFLN